MDVSKVSIIIVAGNPGIRVNILFSENSSFILKNTVALGSLSVLMLWLNVTSSVFKSVFIRANRSSTTMFVICIILFNLELNFLFLNSYSMFFVLTLFFLASCDESPTTTTRRVQAAVEGPICFTFFTSVTVC